MADIGKSKGGPHVDPDVVARIVVDAAEIGDARTAARHGVSERTVKRYRSRSRIEPELSRLVEKKVRAVELGWHAARNALLRSGMAKLQTLIDNATQEQMGEVVAAIAMVGNLEITLASLGSLPGQRDPSAAEDPGVAEPEGDADDGEGDDDDPSAGPH